MIGSTVSRYRVVSQLGGGGMGIVYEAEDLELGRRVAIKFLPEDRAKNPDALERFKREARAASALNHPHICTVHDVGSHDGRPFLVMEKLSGQSLKQAIGRGALTFDRVVSLAEQIADALDAAHRAGMVHRDVKPANLFITERDEAKVLDFGLAKWTSGELSGPVTADAPTIAGEHLTEEGKTLGTVAYMSPEQARGGALDGRSDIFSFGVVLYEMATGQLPFQGGSAAEYFASILRSQPEPPSRWNPDLPLRFDEIVLKALEKDPAMRYQSVADLRSDLLRLQRDSAASGVTSLGWAPASDPHASAPRSAAVSAPTEVSGAGRRRWITAAAATVIVTLLGVAGWHFLSRPAAASPGLSVLVADTVNRTGDSTFDDTLTELLTTSLNQSRFLSVFPRARAAYVLRLMQRDPASPIDSTVGLEICQREGVGALVAASISTLGDAYVLLVRVLDPAGRELASARETFQNPADTPARIDDAVRDLRAEVGESAASIRASSPPLAEVSSPSLQAVRFYTLGLERQRGGDPQEALTLLGKALEIDPDFAMAHDAVGVVYTNLQDMARAEQHLAKAATLTHRVGEPERHKILADLNLLRRNYDAACGHFQVLTELRSLDPVSHYLLGICKSFQLDFEGAVAETRRGLEMQPYPLGRANLARFLLGAGHSEESLAIADELIAEQPGNLQARFVAGRAALDLGRLDAARENYVAMAASGGEMEAEGHFGLADIALAGGDLESGRRELENAWQAAERRGITLALGRAATAEAELALAAGDAAAFDLAMERLSGLSHPVVLYLRARCWARAGRVPEAAADLARLEQAVSDSEPDRALRAMTAAEVALARGDAAAAVQQSESAFGYEPSVLARETQARAYTAAARPKDAIAAWDDVLARRTQRLDSYDAPGYHRVMDARLHLATLLAESGDAARARPLFESLLSAWASADPPPPAAAEVRRHLAALR